MPLFAFKLSAGHAEGHNSCAYPSQPRCLFLGRAKLCAAHPPWPPPRPRPRPAPLPKPPPVGAPCTFCAAVSLHDYASVLALLCSIALRRAGDGINAYHIACAGTRWPRWHTCVGRRKPPARLELSMAGSAGQAALCCQRASQRRWNRHVIKLRYQYVLGQLSQYPFMSRALQWQKNSAHKAGAGRSDCTA